MFQSLEDEMTEVSKDKTKAGAGGGGAEAGAGGYSAPVVSKLVVGGVVPHFGAASSGSSLAAVLLAPAILWGAAMTVVTAGLVTGAIIMADKGSRLELLFLTSRDIHTRT